MFLIFVIICALAICLLLALQSMAPKRKKGFPGTFSEASQQLQTSATQCSVNVSEASLNDEAQTAIQFIHVGALTSQNLIIHISGTHGVEGFLGSAIQAAILQRGISLPPDTGLLIIHGLNRWGMENFRRVNSNNVDLNRNAWFLQGHHPQANTAYLELERFFNPSSPARRISTFYAQVLAKLIKPGFRTVKQALGGGQYQFPDGLYFGGAKLEPELVLLKQILEKYLVHAKRALVVEVHSGLGDYGAETLFWSESFDSKKTQHVQTLTDLNLTPDAADVAFVTSGDLQRMFPKIFPETEFYWFVQEFGAYNPIRTFKALREEHQYVRHGGEDPQHWTKRVLLEVFCPADLNWQRTVQQKGIDLFDKIIKLSESLVKAGDIRK